jgi:hypothetical protein
MTEGDRRKIYSEDYADLIYEYGYQTSDLAGG